MIPNFHLGHNRALPLFTAHNNILTSHWSTDDISSDVQSYKNDGLKP